jgi:hypothetical protein
MVFVGNLGRKVCYGVIVHLNIKNRLKISIEQFTIRELQNHTGILLDFIIGGELWEKVVKNNSYANSWW